MKKHLFPDDKDGEEESLKVTPDSSAKVMPDSTVKVMPDDTAKVTPDNTKLTLTKNLMKVKMSFEKPKL